MFLFDPYACKCFVQIGSSKDNNRSPENKQVFLNSSLVSKRFFQLVKAANSAVHGWPNSEFN